MGEYRNHRTQSLERDPNTLKILVHDKNDISNQWRKDRLISKLFEDNWLTVWEKIELDSYLTTLIPKQITHG